MRKVIKRFVYDTAKSNLIGSKDFSYFGDPAGYHEDLYKTKRGKFFLYGIGGADSKYPEETIVPVSDEEAAAWSAE